MSYDDSGRNGHDQLLDGIIDVAGLIQGLNVQAPQQPLAPTSLSGEGSCEGLGVAVHCYRSVSQRSLGTPTTFLSDQVQVIAGNDIFEPLVHGITGALPGAGPAGVPIEFNDSNVTGERARVDGLMLFGLRGQVAVYCITEDTTAAAFDVGLFTKSIANFVRQYVALRVFNLADSSDPWIDTTSLAYFDRPGAFFIPVPQIVFRDRNPKMDIATRSADKGKAAGQLPQIICQATDVTVQLSIMVQALFMPPPSVCGNLWPGGLCPPSSIKNTDTYKGF